MADHATGQQVHRALRVTDDDLRLAKELGEDPYAPLIGSLRANPTTEEALDGSSGSGGAIRTLEIVFRDRRWLDPTEQSEQWAEEPIGWPLLMWLRRVSFAQGSRDCDIGPESVDYIRLDQSGPPPDPAQYGGPERSSIHVAERCGYLREGRRRSPQEICCIRRDMLLYAATRV